MKICLKCGTDTKSRQWWICPICPSCKFSWHVYDGAVRYYSITTNDWHDVPEGSLAIFNWTEL